MGTRPEITALDRALARDGETVTIRRRVGTSADFADVTARARLSGYSAEKMVGGMRVTDSHFVLSPRPFDGVAWPGLAGGLRYPVIGDLIVSQARVRRIEQVERVMVGNEVVRIEGRCAG